MLAPKDIREHLATVFNVGLSGITEVRDQTVVTDGRTIEDLIVITAEAMAKYVGSMESFARLWELSLARAKHELYPPFEIKSRNHTLGITVTPLPEGLKEVTNEEFDAIQKKREEDGTLQAAPKEVLPVGPAHTVTHVTHDEGVQLSIKTPRKNAKAKDTSDKQD